MLDAPNRAKARSKNIMSLRMLVVEDDEDAAEISVAPRPVRTVDGLLRAIPFASDDASVGGEGTVAAGEFEPVTILGHGHCDRRDSSSIAGTPA